MAVCSSNNERLRAWMVIHNRIRAQSIERHSPLGILASSQERTLPPFARRWQRLVSVPLLIWYPPSFYLFVKTTHIGQGFNGLYTY